MAKHLTFTELGTYMAKRQGKASEVEYSAKVGIPRQVLRTIKTGANRPSETFLATLGFVIAYKSTTTGKVLTFQQLSKHFADLQGTKQDVELAKELNVPRHTVSSVIRGGRRPSEAYALRLGFEIVYIKASA